jgi:YidC/Oxa1 family membrane protein insertase
VLHFSYPRIDRGGGMSQEKRLILAFVLTAGILFTWNSLFPPPKPPQDQPTQSEQQKIMQPTVNKSVKESSLVQDQPDTPEQFQLKPFLFEIGSSTGSIQTLTVDGTPILMRSNPGLLGADLIQPTRLSVPLRTRMEGETIVSEAEAGSFILVRRIYRSNSSSPFTLKCEYSLINQSDQTKIAQLKITPFRTLYTEDPRDKQYTHGFVSINGEPEQLSKIKLKSGEQKNFSAPPDWISSQGKSHILIVRPLAKKGMFHVEHPTGKFQEGSIGRLDLESVTLVPGQAKSWKFDLYIGPADPFLLERVGFEEVLSFGMMSGIVKTLYRFLNWSYSWTHSWGLAICFLSLVAWLPLAPMSLYSMKSAAAMQEKMALIQPAQARIEKEHANNPQKKNQEMMKLWKKHNFNPASGCIGCLPLLITFPIYPALYQLLNRTPQIRGVSFLWIQDLSAPDALIRFGSSLPLIGDSFNLLPILATIGMFFQMTLQQKSMPQPQAATEEQKMQQNVQKMMFKFFPLMLLFALYTAPSGFMLYFALYSLFHSSQQIVVTQLKKRG